MAEHDRPLRACVLPVYYGLAIVAEEERLATNPALAAMLRPLREHRGQQRPRRSRRADPLDEAIFTPALGAVLQQRIERGSRALPRGREGRAARRALPRQRGAARVPRPACSGRTSPDLAPLRDPARLLRQQHQRISQARAAGRSLDGDRNVAYFPYTDMGQAQLDAPRGRCSTSFERARCRATWRRSASVAAGVPSSCAPTWTPTRCAIDGSGWSTSSSPLVRTLDEGDGSLAAAVSRFGADLHQVRDGFARFGLLDDTRPLRPGCPQAPTLHESRHRSAGARPPRRRARRRARSHARSDPPPPCRPAPSSS